MIKPLHIISLGAGVQSSTMALMAAHGEIKPMPDCAIFADTGDESRETYMWIKELCKMLTFPIVWLKPPEGQSLSDAVINKWGFSQIPAWFENKEGKAALGRRQCTKYFKILPVRHELRKRYGKKQNIILWHGISTDEAHRMKPSGLKWLVHRWPLIEKKLNRGDCLAYLSRMTSWNVPKSACVYCPYKDRERWIKSTKNEGEMALIKKVESALIPRGEYLTSDLKPISHIDFRINKNQADMFGNECEGMCGV